MCIFDFISQLFSAAQTAAQTSDPTVELQVPSGCKPGGPLPVTVTLKGGRAPLSVHVVFLSINGEEAQRVPVADVDLEPDQSVSFQVQLSAPTEGSSVDLHAKAIVIGEAREKGLTSFEGSETVTLDGEPWSMADRADEDLVRYDEDLQLRHSSVRGDFRVMVSEDGDGTLACWKHSLVRRDVDGTLLWRRDDNVGKDAAWHPSGEKMAALANKGKKLLILDPETGETQHEHALPNYVDHIIWVGDQLVACTSEVIFVYDDTGALVRQFENLDPEAKRTYWTDLAPASDGETFFAANSNGDTVVHAHATTGEIITRKEWRLDHLEICELGNLLVGHGHHGAQLFTTGLGRTAKIKLPSTRGVLHLGSSTGSYTAFQPLPALSPIADKVAFQDQAGRLWVYDVEGEKPHPIRLFGNDLLQFVEGIAWFNNFDLLVLTNDGMQHRIGVHDWKPEWSERDMDQP